MNRTVRFRYLSNRVKILCQGAKNYLGSLIILMWRYEPDEDMNWVFFPCKEKEVYVY